jgi:hypothetical protein
MFMVLELGATPDDDWVDDDLAMAAVGAMDRGLWCVVMELAVLRGRDPAGVTCWGSTASGVVDGDEACGYIELWLSPLPWVVLELDARDNPGLVPLGAVEEVEGVMLEVLGVGLLRETEEVLSPMLAKAVVTPETWDGPGLVMGWLVLVER